MYYKLYEEAHLKYNHPCVYIANMYLDTQNYIDFISRNDYNLNPIYDIPNNLLQENDLIDYMKSNRLIRQSVFTYLQQNGEETPQILGYEITMGLKMTKEELDRIRNA